MPAKAKDKAAAASPGGVEKLEPEALFKLFHTTYKASCEEFGTSPLPVITQQIAEPENLDWIVLNKERVKPIALSAIAAAIQVLDPDTFYVRHLTLWSCGLGDDAAMTCSELLDNKHRLEQLDLFEEGVTSIGITALGPALSINTFLRELQLNYNPLEDEGIVILTRALAQNKTLQNLHVAFCGFGAEGANALAQNLIGNPECVLQILSMRGNEGVGIDGAKSLLEAARQSMTITEIDMSETFKLNHVMNNPTAGEHGLRTSLRDSLAGHPSLSKVDLRGNHIDSEDATTLLALVQTNRNLTHILVDRDLGAVFGELNVVLSENQDHAAKMNKTKGKKKKK